MMIINLFRKKSKAYFFAAEEWRFNEEKKMYCLTLSGLKCQLTPTSEVYLYKQQGERYIFMSKGYETLAGNELVYYSLSPFSGRIRFK